MESLTANARDSEKAGAEEPLEGEGTVQSPFVVKWGEADPSNPLNFGYWRKWVIVANVVSPFSTPQKCWETPSLVGVREGAKAYFVPELTNLSAC